MARKALSHSKSLRVIGQRLYETGVSAFELSKKGDEYNVRIDPSSVVGKLSTGKIVRDSIRQNIFGDYARAVPLSFKFTRAEILWSDDAERLKRIKPSALPDIGHLSVVLRVLGDYLDRNAADDFAILWSTYSVKVCHGDKEQTLTAQDLYDLGIVMYLRSSNHTPVKGSPPGRGNATQWVLRQSETRDSTPQT
jgi:hypothetical protein